MDSPSSQTHAVPPWVRKLGLPVWVSGPDRRILFVNRRAEELLGRLAGSCLGEFCYEVVRGRDASRQPFCDPACELACSTRSGGGEMEPVEMVLQDHRGEHWIQVLAIPVTFESGCMLVHCALPFDRPHRIESYMERVAHRTPGCENGKDRVRRLTPRERDVLDLLAQDETLNAIADRLNLSYATVRNHVQHILTKLEAHSIPEAVAQWVLVGAEGGQPLR